MSDILLLSENDIIKCITIKKAIEINKNAFELYYLQRTNVPDRMFINIPSKGVTLFKPALVDNSALGLKIVSVRSDNSNRNLPTVPATILLINCDTGLPLSLMGATYLTALRTAAGSGVATELCAKTICNTITVYGAGMQGEQHIHAMLSVRPMIKEVNIINRSKDRAIKLADKLAKQYNNNIVFNAFDSSDTNNIKLATESADIICTTTNSSTPLFDGRWIKQGCHLNCIGAYTKAMQEVDEFTLKQCKSVIVDCENAIHECGDLVVPIENKSIDLNDISELGEIINKNNFKRLDNDITLFKSVGIAIQDIATAHAIVKEAKKMNIGTPFLFAS